MANEGKVKKHKPRRFYDYSLLFTIIFLTAFGPVSYTHLSAPALCESIFSNRSKIHIFLKFTYCYFPLNVLELNHKWRKVVESG